MACPRRVALGVFDQLGGQVHPLRPDVLGPARESGVDAGRERLHDASYVMDGLFIATACRVNQRRRTPGANARTAI